MRNSVGIVLLAIIAASDADAECGEDPCDVSKGRYAIALPEGIERPGAFVYLHGYASNAKAALGNSPLRDPTLARGMAFLAPEGQVDELQGKHLDWSVNDGASYARNDVDFISDVIADAVSRFALDPGYVIVAGYSRGGSMAWDLACNRPDLAVAFASYAGGFWEPMPHECVGPVHLWHGHGFGDRTVPMEGQRLHWFGHPFEMGDLSKALGVWRTTMACSDKADVHQVSEEPWLKQWTSCVQGSISFALYSGNHKRPIGWVDTVLDWADQLPD